MLGGKGAAAEYTTPSRTQGPLTREVPPHLNNSTGNGSGNNYGSTSERVEAPRQVSTLTRDKLMIRSKKLNLLLFLLRIMSLEAGSGLRWITSHGNSCKYVEKHIH
jgi:hypothetical protein